MPDVPDGMVTDSPWVLVHRGGVRDGKFTATRDHNAEVLQLRRQLWDMACEDLCLECDGSGTEAHDDHIAPEFWHQVCSECEGTGKR